MTKRNINYETVKINGCEFYHIDGVYYNVILSEEGVEALHSLVITGAKATFEYGLSTNEIWASETTTGYVHAYKGNYPILVHCKDKCDDIEYPLHEECLVRITDESGNVLFEKK